MPCRIAVSVLLLMLSLTFRAEATMSRAEALQMTAAAGMSVQGGQILNPCGHATSPQIRFVDLNGDGSAEAVVLDHDQTCYGSATGYQSKILARSATGQWRLIGAALGIYKPLPTRTQGWVDYTIEGTGCQPVWSYTGREYLARKGCPGAAAPQAAASPPAAAPLPSAHGAAIGAADRTMILRAAGAQQRGGRWIGCADAGASAADDISATVDEVRDVNGDGLPEAVVTLHGSACFGMAGQGFAVVTRQADGRWTQVASETGIPTFLPTKGRDGWPDIEVGGPGFCFPVLRWNGRTYAVQRREYEGKPCRG